MKFIHRSKALRGKGIKPNPGNDILHHSFQVGIILKGLDGILEIVGGILLTLVSPLRLHQIIVLLTQHELAQDPRDILVNLILKVSQNFSIQSQHFAIFYLFSHGVVKLILVSLLLRKKPLAYPIAIGFLILFVIYQVARYQYSHSLGLLLLTIFDVAVIFLTGIEYRRITHARPQNP